MLIGRLGPGVLALELELPVPGTLRLPERDDERLAPGRHWRVPWREAQSLAHPAYTSPGGSRHDLPFGPLMALLGKPCETVELGASRAVQSAPSATDGPVQCWRDR